MDNPACPKISLVTPSYNQGEFLEETILSVLDQNYPALEYIVIDGGSSDNSLEILKKYDKHLHYWVSEQDEGQYHAINKGFAIATGDVFAWLNSSDFYLPWTLKTVGSIFQEKPEVSWLTTLNKLSFSEDGFCVNTRQVPAYSREAFLDGCYLPIWPRNLGWVQQESTFWRSELWQKAGGLNAAYRYAADFDLWCKFFKYAQLHGISSPLAGHRYHRGQISQIENKYKDEAERILNEARVENSMSPLNRKLKVCNDGRVLSSLVKTAISYRDTQVIGKFLEIIREFVIFSARSKYKAEVVVKSDVEMENKWELIDVNYKI